MTAEWDNYWAWLARINEVRRANLQGTPEFDEDLDFDEEQDEQQDEDTYFLNGVPCQVVEVEG